MSGPAMSISELLDQEEVWYASRHGELTEMRLAEMPGGHLANLRAWLLRNAGSLHSAAVSGLYGLASFIGGEMAADDLDRSIASLEEMSPQAWMEEQPLFEAITRRLGELLEETHGA